MGLTTSLSGLILVLMILADITQTGDDYPLVLVMGQILLLCFLMASRIRFPALSWFVPHWGLYVFYAIAIIIMTLLFSVYNAVWTFWLCVLAASFIQHFIRARWDKVTN